jgi:ABC-type Mn2+/Zn2+ transport system permease subunit
MSILMGFAVAWLAAAGMLMLTFYGRRYSRRLSAFLFGQPVSTNVHRLEPRAERDVNAPERLAA